MLVVWSRTLHYKYHCVLTHFSVFGNVMRQSFWINKLIFFQAGTVTNPTIWLVLSTVRIFLSLTTVTVTLAWAFFSEFFFFSLRAWKKKCYTGLGSVRIVKNCDRRLENAARGHRPRVAFSRPRSYRRPYRPPSWQITYMYYMWINAVQRLS